MRIIVIFCFIFLANESIAEYPLIEVAEGSEFNLMCQVPSSNREKYSCILKKNNFADQCTYGIHQQRNQYSPKLECSTRLLGRVEFIGDVEKGICNWKVSNTTSTDIGSWICEVRMNGYSIDKKWINVEMVRSYFAIEGSPMTLECPSNLVENYCVFSHKNKTCCRISDNWWQSCQCEDPNYNIDFVEQKCQFEIARVSLKDSGDWICNVNIGNFEWPKVKLLVTPKFNIGTTTEKNLDHTNYTEEQNNLKKFEDSTITLIIVGSVCCVIVCGLISVGILYYYSKKYPH